MLSSSATSMPCRSAAERTFFSSALLRGLALELGLVEAGDGVPDVGFVVDRQVAFALAVDVRELVVARAVAGGFGELRHDSVLRFGSVPASSAVRRVRSGEACPRGCGRVPARRPGTRRGSGA